MKLQTKILLAIILGVIYYCFMDYDDINFFNFKNEKFYLKLLISISFGVILTLTINRKKRS